MCEALLLCNKASHILFILPILEINVTSKMSPMSRFTFGHFRPQSEIPLAEDGNRKEAISALG